MLSIGYIPGVWDLLHVGHLAILGRARSLCDRLVVGVPCDEVVLEDKGCLPVIPLDDRIQMLEALICVDAAIPYYFLEFMTHLESVKPDVLVVGETWGAEVRHNQAIAWADSHGCRIVQLPYRHEVSTSAIKARITKRT